MANRTLLQRRALAEIRAAALDQRPVIGGPHEFYRYPARFAPAFATTVIQSFTNPGDLILDAFVGGGTTLVEAQRLGRPSVGFDINPLATFVSEAKVTLYSKQALDALTAWGGDLSRVLKANLPAQVDAFWKDSGYLRNFASDGWWLRKLIAQALTSLEGLSHKPRLLARCALLRTGQWALDLRDDLPTAQEFRDHLSDNLATMTEAARAYRSEVNALVSDAAERESLRPAVALRSAQDVVDDHLLASRATPKLILTSPPYPGVYVNYHRWKIHARKETPLPYWIANSLDGRGLSHYILGPRQEPNLKQYFANLRRCFTALTAIADRETWFVQIVGFSNPEDQLPRFIATLRDAGLRERTFAVTSTAADGRLWRDVPGRRWFAKTQESAASTAREVVLFHQLR